MWTLTDNIWQSYSVRVHFLKVIVFEVSLAAACGNFLKRENYLLSYL